jgi:hypothetical protein
MTTGKLWTKDNLATICSWATLIFGAAAFFWISRGTSYQQLAVGILASAVTLVLLMLVFEGLWQLATMAQRI